MTQAALAYPFAIRSRARTAFVDLPEDIRDKVIEHFPDEFDRIKISTCHSSMAGYDYLSDLVLKLPLGTEKVTALSTWAISTNRRLLNIYIEDERDAFWSMDETARDRLIDGLAASSDDLERLAVVSMSTPYRALVPVMRNAKLAHFPANNPFPSDLSLETCTKLETLLITEIENKNLDEDAAVDFGGIAKAPALREVYIIAQRGRFWLSDLPLVKDTLETLIIVGTEVDAGIVHNLEALPHMSKLQILALDSFSSHLTADLALAMPHLECLDLSRRHDDFDWRNILEDLFEYSYDEGAVIYDAVKEFKHLKELGCRDIFLTDEFEAPTVRTLHMSLLSFLVSSLNGFTTTNVPLLESIVIDGAFTGDSIDQEMIDGVVGVLKAERAMTLKLKKSPHDNLSVMDTFWSAVARELPHIAIEVYGT